MPCDMLHCSSALEYTGRICTQTDREIDRDTDTDTDIDRQTAADMDRQTQTHTLAIHLPSATENPSLFQVTTWTLANLLQST